MKKSEVSYLIFLSTICIYFMGMAFKCLHVANETKSKLSMVLFIFLLLAIGFTAYHFLKYSVKIDAEKDLFRQKEEIQKQYLLDMEKQQLEIEKMEINSTVYLEHIFSLLEDDRVDETKEFIDNLVIQNKKNSWEQMSNVPLIDAVIHTKLDKCRELGIRLDMNVEIPSTVSFDKGELISIFHNLLDNAVEACERMEEDEDRWLYCHSGAKNGQFVLHVENSIRRNEVVTGETWKIDALNHGIGHQIVQEIVKRHNGQYQVQKSKKKYSVIITAKLLKRGNA